MSSLLICDSPGLDLGAQRVPIDDAAGHRFKEVRMRDRVEILRQIGVYDVGEAPADQPVRFLDCIDRAAPRTIAIGAVLEVRLEDRPRVKARGLAAA
jgi:hypothetical protein